MSSNHVELQLDINQLFDAIHHGALIFTPNQRLAAALTQQYNQQQAKLKKTAWASPNIISIQSWFADMWQQLTHHNEIELPQLLTDYQSLMIWRNIIHESDATNVLINEKAAAVSAQSAWGILQQWNIDIDKDTFSYPYDSAAFYQWANQFSQYCQQHDLIDKSIMMHKVISLLNQHSELITQKSIIFANFDEFNPIIKKLIIQLKQSGIQLYCFEAKLNSSAVKTIAFEEKNNQLENIALHCKSLIEQGEKNIGIVVPNLQKDREQISRVFSQHINNKNHINISGGQSLYQFPIIRIIFDCFSLLDSHIDYYQLLRLLRSPFLANSETERYNRAKLADHINQLNTFTIRVEQLKKHTAITELISAIAIIPANKQQSPSQWANYFSNILKQIGWPGERVIDSNEYQAISRWQLLLSEFAGLSIIYPLIDKQQAIYELKLLTQQCLFQPESADDAPIYILGLLEAAGLTFDTLFILDLTDEHWPSSARPNPFIPLALQRIHHMPHASAERELAFSQKLTQRFSQSAKYTYFCYYKKDQDHEYNISPLIQNFELIDLPIQTIPVVLNNSLEVIPDDTAPVVQLAEKIRGGTFILKDQAICPFKAFSRYRLGADSQTKITLGLNALAKGSLVHYALEHFWHITKTQKQLLNYDQKTLASVINISLQKALKHLQKSYEFTISNAVIMLEKKRLQRLIYRWLLEEKARPDFSVIGIEEKAQIQIGKLNLSMRIDRIDKLADGSKLIIDYKTNITQIKNSLEPRPSEPQLALYSITIDNVVAVAFAQVRADKLYYNGISQANLNIKGIQPLEHISWPEQLANWRNELTQLSDEFTAGYAAIEPKNALSCQYCNLHTICRRFEWEETI